MSDPTETPQPYPGLPTQVLVTVVAAFLGSVVAYLSLGARQMLYGPSSRVLRYSMEEGGMGQQLNDILIAVPMGAVFFARVAQLAAGLIARLRGQRVVLGQFRWWDIAVLGVPFAVWSYLVHAANVN